MSLPEVNSPRARDPDTTTLVSSESNPATAVLSFACPSLAAKRARLRWLQSARSLCSSCSTFVTASTIRVYTIISFSGQTVNEKNHPPTKWRAVGPVLAPPKVQLSTIAGIHMVLNAIFCLRQTPAVKRQRRPSELDVLPTLSGPKPGA